MRCDESKFRRAAALLLELAAANAGGSLLADEETARVLPELANDEELLTAFVRLSGSVADGFAELIAQNNGTPEDLAGALHVVEGAFEMMIADAQRER